MASNKGDYQVLILSLQFVNHLKMCYSSDTATLNDVDQPWPPTTHCNDSKHFRQIQIEHSN